MTEDSKNEIRKKLNSRDYYVAPDGRMAFSVSTDVINLVLAYITG